MSKLDLVKCVQAACFHLTLKRCNVGTTYFYRCAECKLNFKVPNPLVIKVSYPENAATPPKDGKL